MAFDGVGVESIVFVAVLIALVAFFYSNLGLGGGQLYVPIMDLFFVSFFMKEIVPLSLTFAFVTMISSAYTHSKKRLVDFRLGLLLAAAGLIGVVGGVVFTTEVDDRVVKSGFALLLVIVATKMIFDVYRGKKSDPVGSVEITSSRKLAGIGVSIITGFLVGSFGIGGGVVSVPLIIYVFRIEARRAIGTSALMGAILTPAAFIAYALSAGEGVVIHYQLAVLLAPIVFVMAIVGSTWGLRKLRTPMVMMIFTCGVYLAATWMIISVLFR